MRVTAEHQKAARGLTGSDRLDTTNPGAPAAKGYLAAVERVESIGFASSTDTSDDDLVLSAYPLTGTIALPVVHMEATVGRDETLLVWTPTQARERAYELLVLADMAEAPTSRATEGPA